MLSTGKPVCKASNWKGGTLCPKKYSPKATVPKKFNFSQFREEIVAQYFFFQNYLGNSANYENSQSEKIIFCGQDHRIR